MGKVLDRLRVERRSRQLNFAHFLLGTTAPQQLPACSICGRVGCCDRYISVAQRSGNACARCSDAIKRAMATCPNGCKPVPDPWSHAMEYTRDLRHLKCKTCRKKVDPIERARALAGG